jgi:hypothetical protein
MLGGKRAERSVLVAQRLLQRDRRYLVQEREIQVLLHRGQGPVGLRVRSYLALAGVSLLPCGEGPVPYDPDAAESAVQRRLLCLVGVSPAAVRSPHGHKMSGTTVKPVATT